MVRRRGRTVLWGARRGDVQYGSRAYWMTRIPFGSVVLEIDSSAWFGPGDLVVATRTGERLKVTGRECGRLGVER